MNRYSKVDASKVKAPNRYEIRRPLVSAITPVGISKTTWPAVKKALAAKASVLVRPASSRKRVLMPQINDADSVESKVNVK